MKKSNGFLVNKNAILFLNGEQPHQLPKISDSDIIYCTDGSYFFLKENNIIPNIVSGDFDSLSVNEIDTNIRVIETPNQEYTDFEKALRIIVDDGFSQVKVYGASGKEQDHFIGNLNAALKFKTQIEIIFIDNYSHYYFLNKVEIIKSRIGRKVSLVPFPFAHGIITKGLMYPLNNESLEITGRIGTRNESISEEIKIEFKTGNLLIYLID